VAKKIEKEYPRSWNKNGKHTGLRLNAKTGKRLVCLSLFAENHKMKNKVPKENKRHGSLRSGSQTQFPIHLHQNHIATEKKI
jgi:hypothetical protein